MKVVLIDLMNGGEIFQQLHGKLVTIPEIAILRHIHGPDAVYNVRPLPKTVPKIVRDKEGRETDEVVQVPWEPTSVHEKTLMRNDQNAERDRLRKTYGRDRGTQQLIADIVFPGAVAKLPDTLEEIGMSPADMAANMRAKAKALMEAAEAMEASEGGAAEGDKPGKKAAA